ncbi:MAG: LysR substrate-binding domain-containing protein [Geminicoccaceae bacterium]
MDRFTELQTFVAVADKGGFNAAARKLNRSPPTVTRIVAGLEQRIGTRLFSRTTRQVALTEAGERLFRDARQVLDDLGIAEAAASGAHEEPKGVLSVTASVIFGRRYVAPILRDFVDRYPEVSTRALFLDRNVNLIEEGLDVAVRIGDLPSSSLTAVRVGEVRWILVASPGYLERHGELETLDDLLHHRLAAPSSITEADRWGFEVAGVRRNLEIAPAFVANTIDASIDAAREGWAITRVLSYQVSDELRSGELVEVLAGYEDRCIPIHLVHAEGPLRAAKIRAFVDHAARLLRKEAHNWAK